MVTVNQITPIPISELPNATTITGNEATAIVQNGQTVQSAINSLPQGMTAGVVTYGVSGGAPFPNYRTLKAGSGISFIDAGAQGDLTISTTGGAPGSGTVISVSVVTANGISGSVASPTSTPAITLSLGAITPSSVNSIVLSGSSSPHLAVTGTATISGTNTGDQTNITGNAGTATALQTGRAINGVTFNGTAPITITAAAGTLTGTTLASNVVISSLTSVGTLTDLSVTNPITGSISGNAATVTTINGKIAQGTNVTITGTGTTADPYVITSSATAATAFSALTSATNTTAAMIVGTGASLAAAGSGTITATAVPASGITGTTLAASVVTSSLTTVGTLGSVSVTGNITNAALSVSSAVATDGSKNLISVTNTGTGNNVLATSPTLVTPALGAATGTSLNLSGLTISSAVATDGSKNLVSVTNTGSGNNVLATSPTLVTPTLGAASATTINKVTITAPAASATLTIANGKTLTASNTITLTATDGSTLAIGTGGTLGTAAYVSTGTSGASLPFLNGINTWSGVQSFNPNDFALKGSSSGTTLLNASATASGTITIPATTDTLVGKATTDTFTHKTYDTAGTGNVFRIAGVQISAISGNTNTVATTSGSLVLGNTAIFDTTGNIIDSGAPPPSNATNSTFGLVKPDNSSITVSAGVITANFGLMTALGVGSIIAAQNNSGGTIAAGATTSASNLQILQIGVTGSWVSGSDSISGTWQALQTVDSGNGGSFQRTI